MWILYIITTIMSLPYMLMMLIYSACLYLFLALPFRFVGKVLGKKHYGKAVALYARNIALGVPDQDVATFLGQDPRVSISESLGRAALANDEEPGAASGFVLWWCDFVDLLFYNKLYKIEKNHVREATKVLRRWAHTVTFWHKSDGDTLSGGDV